MTSTLRPLVENALYGRSMSGSKACFKANLAGIELLQSSSESLSAIEEVLNDVVIPTYNSVRHEDFIGLSYVLGAYFVIASRSDMARASSVFERLPHPLKVESITSIGAFGGWRIQGDATAPTSAAELSQFVKTFATSEDVAIRAAAQRALKRLALDDYIDVRSSQ